MWWGGAPAERLAVNLFPDGQSIIDVPVSEATRGHSIHRNDGALLQEEWRLPFLRPEFQGQNFTAEQHCQCLYIAAYNYLV